MKLMKKKLGIILIIIICLIGGFLMLKPLFANQQLKNTKLRDCTYSCGGGMLGGHSSATIRRMEDGSVKYITKYAAAHYERIVTNTYEAKEEDLERIKNMSIDYKMLQASKKGLSPIQVLDGDTCTVSFWFEDGTSFSVSDTQNLSSTEMKHMNEIAKTLSEFAVGEPVTEIEKHEMRLILNGYQIGYLLEETKATDQLIEELGEFTFTKKEDYAQVIKFPISLDFTGLEETKNVKAGDLGYNPTTNEVFFFYEDVELEDKIYLLGEMEYRYSSSFELLKNLEEGEYTIYLGK